MDKFIIWGTGDRAKNNYIFFKKINPNIEIVAFIDSDEKKQNTYFNGIKIIAPKDIGHFDWDYIDIWVDKYLVEIQNQLFYKLNVAADCLKDVFYEIRDRIISKYENTTDEEIKQFILNFKNKKWVSIYNFQPMQRYEMSKVHFDEIKKLPFTLFEGKRLYLTRNYPLITIDGEKYISSFWGEQDLNSPHKYEDDMVYVKDGDVLVDAGACEGNFSLHNIDKVSKLYLIECDPQWVEALTCTFEPWKEKVVICSKYLGKEDSETTICLDSLVEGDVNFIKMDIEGAERSALQGSQKLIDRSNEVRCSICSYHKHGDEDYIENFFAEKKLYFYHSKGYMWFFLDNEALTGLELRRGIIRAMK